MQWTLVVDGHRFSGDGGCSKHDHGTGDGSKVTFVLPGFSTVVRESIELPSNFTPQSTRSCGSARSRRR